MNELLNQEVVHRVADQLLSQGLEPTAQRIGEKMGILASAELQGALDSWWRSLEGRICVTPDQPMPPPASLGRALNTLWEDAVREAVTLLSVERHRLDVDLEQLRKESEDTMRSHKVRYEDLEDQYRQEAFRAKEAQQLVKVVEAELAVLKSSLAIEVESRNEVEEKLQEARNELKLAQQALEDAKKLFDTRIREEQQRAQELTGKSDADLRHARASLERLRDEAGKKESTLTKMVHDLQADVAKRDVKVETLQGQVKGLETELRSSRKEAEIKLRDYAKLNSNLLSETNKNKRLEDRVKQSEQALKEAQQKHAALNAESTRREADLRLQLKARDEELMRLKAQLGSAQKKLMTFEDQMRRGSPRRSL